MRSGKEIAFRLRQEATNLWLLARRPAAPGRAEAPLAGLPDPERVAAAVRGTAFAAELERLAGLVLEHRFPLLGVEVETGPQIAWRRDYQRGIETGLRYFRLIPSLDCRRAGDHKLIWELNRHQHLVLLAQAFCCSGRREYLEELFGQLESWWEANPYQRGINWSSALEVAFRALSWMWVYHLSGEQMPPAMRGRFLTELYRHGLHVAANLSVYFSPNTHLLGEAVALHALGALLPAWPVAARWRRKGAEIVREEMERQVREDGSHFEQSSYYHLYALDLFLFHALIEEPPAGYRRKLEAMADYLAALAGPSGMLPFLGDDDGGRVFHPYGLRTGFGRATLATCGAVLGRQDLPYGPEDLFEQAAWWVGPEALAERPVSSLASRPSRWFPDAGVAMMRSGGLEVIVDAGPFGSGSGGHSHSDTLSVIARRKSQELLVDAGTYAYVAEPGWRAWFRSSAAHNTVRLDGREQAVPAGPFRWRDKPLVRMAEWTTGAAQDYLDADCRYAGLCHRRRVVFIKPHLLLILDRLEGPAGGHLIEQFWHLGAPARMVTSTCFQVGDCAVLALSPGPAVELSEGGEHGWRSRAFGAKAAAPVVHAAWQGRLPMTLVAALWLHEGPEPLDLELAEEGTLLRLQGGLQLEIRIREQGTPVLPNLGLCVESQVF